MVGFATLPYINQRLSGEQVTIEMAEETKDPMHVLIRGAAALGLDLSPQQVEQFRLFQESLLDWNRRINLTSIDDPSEVQRLHFLDSLTLCQAMPQATSGGLRVLDVGTGAGFPGLPVKLAMPSASLALIESTGKKVRFLEHLIGLLRLDDVEIYQGRAEDLAHVPGLRSAFDVVTARGLASLNVLAELTLAFCRVGGRVLLPKKGRLDREMWQARGALQTLGGRLVESRPVTLEGLRDDRCILVIEKERETPSQYPRRPGIPHKRPL